MMMKWYNPHISMMLSNADRAVHMGLWKAGDPVEEAFIGLKGTLHFIFGHSAGAQGNRAPCIFALSYPEREEDDNDRHGGIYTILFVPSIRLDLVAHTFVADCWVLPITIDFMFGNMQVMETLVRIKKFEKDTPGDEIIAWKQILPALAERRRTWTHKETCEYRAEGTNIPLSTRSDGSPICSCGRGVGTEDVPLFQNEWKPFSPFVTHAALSPLFPVSYLGSATQDSGTSTSASLTNIERCTACGGAGKPGLLLCGACKSVKYCSTKCQKEHWKEHL